MSDRTIRVLHFADVINRFDFIDNLIRHADPESFELAACTFRSASNIEPPHYERDGIDHWVLGVSGRRHYAGAALRLARLLKRERIEVLHTHHYEPAAIGWLATRLHRGARLVVGRHYSDAIYLHTTGMRRRAWLGVESIVNRGATRIVVPSRMIRELLTDRQGVAAAKIDLVPYAFDPEKYVEPAPDEVAALRSEVGCDRGLVIGTFARLYADKGHRFLVDALASLPKKTRDGLVWVVVGEGPERVALERLIREAGLEGRVRFLGWRHDVPALMAACDVVVQPTIQEAFSQVMVEALWMRRPLIVSRVSAAEEVVDDGQNGILVAPGSAASLAGALERVLVDGELRSALGDAGRQSVEQRLTLRHVVPRYEQVYRRALRG